MNLKKNEILKNLEILQCPNCNGNLIFSKEQLQCIFCKKQFPIIKRIPIFLGKKI